MALNQKKFLDSAGLTYFAQLLDNYPDNEVLASVIDAISDALDEKVTICYGTCATAADTAQKVVTIDNVTELTTGLTVLVKFTYSNTVANPTLKINNLDAKAIKRYGTTAPSTSAASSWNAGSVVTLTYDGTYWQMHDWLNTTYSAMSQSEMQTGTATSGRNITAARLKEAIQYHAPVTDVEVDGTSVVSNGVAEITIPTKVSDLTNDSGFITSYTDTKNTAGSTDASSKLFLIGATAQATNPQTYSHDTAYIGTDGCLYSGGAKTLVDNYSAGEYTYLNFTTNVVENQNDYALANLDLQASSFDGNLYSVLNYFIGSHEFSIQSQTLEKVFIQINNFSDSNFGDNNVGIYNLRTPTADADAANKKYVDDAVANKITLADLPIYDGTVV